MGRIYQPEYWKKMPDGTQKKVKTRAWYAEWQSAGKTKHKKIGTKEAARTALAKFEDEEVRRKHGLLDPAAESAKRTRPLVEYLADYVELLEARGAVPEYRATTNTQLTRTLTECKWHVWADVTEDGLRLFLGRLRDKPQPRKLTGAAKTNGGAQRAAKTPRRGLGPATLNGYLRAAKGFTRWIAENLGVLDPLRKFKKFVEAVDVRRSRRILTDEELGKLLAAAAEAKRKSGATVWGANRAMLYRLAAYTGLRAGELSDLTPGHFSLDAQPPVVTVIASDAKGKREEPVPLPDHVVELLRPWLAGRGAREKLFPGDWAKHRKQTQWLAADLARAGVDARDGEGRPVTFHSLKRRFVVRLIQSGAKVHEVRRMARHTDVSTTLKHYTDENMKELGDLANRLPKV